MKVQAVVCSSQPAVRRCWLSLVAMVTMGSQSLWAAPDPQPDGVAKHATLDEKLAAVARDVPGFGGMFFDENGDLAVYLTQAHNREAARQKLAQVFGSERLASRAPSEGRSADRRTLPAGEIRVVQGQYGFNELEHWRKSAAELLNVDGVVFTDIDESKNRIVVGVSHRKARALAESMLVSLGVPGAAWAFEEIAAPKPLATLSDYFGPVFGGLAISNNGKNCSLGFNAYWGPYAGFVTASHCSTSQGNLDYSYFKLRGTYSIGYELRDPPFWTSIWPWDCPWGRRCRWSDAAFVHNPNWIGFQYARIARTTHWNGSVTLNPTAPTFTLSTEDDPVMNQAMDKVGAETGWTYGRVSGTCVDLNLPGTNMTLKCQSRVTATARAGDSGAPVFEWHADGNVYLAGIVALGNGSDYWFSPIVGIREDLYLPGYGLQTYF